MNVLEDSFQDALPQIRVSLEKGGVVLYPTDTIYGSECDARLPESVAQVEAVKGRKNSKPLIVLAGSLEIVEEYFIINEIKNDLLALWPGPFTVLLEPLEMSLDYLKGPSGKIGVRIPKDSFLSELFLQWRGLLVSTSANLSGEPYQHDWEALQEQFTSRVDLSIRRRNYPLMQPSAVIEFENSAWKVLRKGPEPLPF
jgi:L-threonylcarbamoyladenylate synthase